MATPIGKLGFNLEIIIEHLIEQENLYWSNIFKIFANELRKYPENREEYCEGGFPKLAIVQGKKRRVYSPKIKDSKINQITKNNLEKLISQYCLSHQMQWGEVLYLVYGYLVIHRPDAKDCELFYGPLK